MNFRNKIGLFIVLLLMIFIGVIIYHYSPTQNPQTKNAQKTENFLTGNKEDDIKKIVENWIIKECLTYKFDGMDLVFDRLKELNPDDCPDCYIAEYEFKSNHIGYGDRTGDILVEIVVPHSITLLISDGKVSRAVTDAKYDEIRNEFINIGI